MATKSAIGKMQGEAQTRLTAAMETLSKKLGVAPLDIGSIRYRDPAYEHAAQITALATWAEELAAAIQAAAEESPKGKSAKAKQGAGV